MPISFVLRTTEYAIVPYRPIEASETAKRAKKPQKVVIIFCWRMESPTCAAKVLVRPIGSLLSTSRIVCVFRP